MDDDDHDTLGTLISLDGMEHLHQVIDALMPMPESPDDDEDTDDPSDTQPVPDPMMFPPCLQPIVDVCTRDSEAVPVAVAINILLRFSALVGPMVYLPIGDERRCLNEFVLMVGPTGLGKGSSNHGPSRLFRRVEEYLALDLRNQFQAGKSQGINKYPLLNIHTGGLSSGEGLAAAMDDGKEGNDREPPVTDKRLLVFESEFSNVMSMHHRSGNIVSMVLRNAYDGVDIKPLTKRDKVRVTDPYVCLFANITDHELRDHEQSKSLANNGMLNRFLILWQQPVRDVPFPRGIPDDLLDQQAGQIASRVLQARQNSHETHYRKVREQRQALSFSDGARALWVKEYRKLLNRPDCESVMILTRRHRLHAMILASLFALMSGRNVIEAGDIHSALAWCEYSRQSVVYIFNAESQQTISGRMHQLSRKLLYAIALLNHKHGQCTATDLYRWLNGKVRREQLHGALRLLLNHIPPMIIQSKVVTGRGRPMYLYSLSKDALSCFKFDEGGAS